MSEHNETQFAEDPLDSAHPEIHSSAADHKGGLGSPGMVTVWDHEGRYVGCMGSQTWRWLLSINGSARYRREHR